MSFLYGMEQSNHDFSSPESLGKNIFTNAFPLSMIQYASIERGLSIPLIRATAEENGAVGTEHVKAPWSSLIGTDPSTASFNFETVFDGYNQYTHNGANKSDVVVSNGHVHTRPFEIKLVVVPTSSSARSPREQQSCEIVTRPSTIEQIAFSIANSFGHDRRMEMAETINEALGHPHDYEWENESYMAPRVPRFKKAAENLIRAGIDVQTPLVITAVWRTKGQSPEFDDQAFDAFVWTDLAFLQLFIDSASTPKAPGRKVGRPSRALMWLISCLYEFAAQGTFNFARTTTRMSFGGQSDKAGAFAGRKTLKFLQSEEFLHPRLSRYDIENIITNDALGELLPERRLDQAIALQYLTSNAELRGFEAGLRYAARNRNIAVDQAFTNKELRKLLEIEMANEDVHSTVGGR